MDKMQQQIDPRDVNEGKKLFADKTNRSANINMYPVVR